MVRVVLGRDDVAITDPPLSLRHRVGELLAALRVGPPCAPRVTDRGRRHRATVGSEGNTVQVDEDAAWRD